MELEELKAGWDAFDKRLTETEIVNLRMEKEMIGQKTRSAYDGIVGQNIYNLVVCLLISCVVFPYVYANTPIRLFSFAIVETIIVLGMIPQVWKLTLLSGFNLESKTCNELSRLVLRYKKLCHQETIWGIAGVCIAMVAFYISELGFNQEAGYVLGTRLILPMALSLLTFTIGYFLALWMRRRHAMQMAEIERGLEELKEFEN